MRNITQEAIKYAEAEFIRDNPEMENRANRQRLDPFTKQAVISNLILIAQLYEDQVIAGLRPNR